VSPPFETCHPRPVSHRVARWLVARRVWLAIVAVALAAWAVDRSRHLVFSRSIDAMFDRRDPALVPYERVQRTFGSSEVVLAAYDDPDLFTPDGISRLRDLTAELAGLPGVDTATSLASTPLGTAIVDLDAPLTGGWARRLVSVMEGYVVGADRRTAGIACVLEPPDPGLVTARSQAVSRAVTIDRLRDRMAALPQGTVAGEPAMLRDGFAMLERDGNLLGTASGLLAGGVLLAAFRSLRWLTVPLAVVLLALWTTRGILAAAGLRLTMVSTMLSAMITVVGIATVTHVIVEFRRRRSEGLAPPEALEAAIAALFWPVCGAIATDVVGFAALTASRVGPVRDFGIMTAIGAAAVLVAAALALPFVALVASRFDTDPRRAWGEGTLERWLDGLVRRIVRHPGPILAGATAVVIAAVAGMGRLEVETDFTRNFRADSPTVVAYDMVESRLGGAGVWEVLVPAPDPVDGDTLLRLDRLAARLRSEVRAPGAVEPALTKVLSVVDVLGAAALVRVAPGSLMALGVNALALGDTDGSPGVARPLVGRDPRDGSVWLRLMLRARERQPAATKRAIIADVRRIAAEEFPGAEGEPAAEVTGFFVLLAQLVDRILADQWLTFGLSAIGIFLLLAVAFASPLLAAVALVPNGLPIFVVLGLLGWAGVRINMGTAMIAAVSLGLSVDSSIHYIVAFRRRLAEGQPLAAALETAHGTAGRAMVFSTLALVVGFLSLTTSGFIPTVSFGWLSCLTLAGGLLGNLVVLPVLLVLLAPWIAPGCQPVAKPLQH
jgi:uncharacterized protein